MTNKINIYIWKKGKTLSQKYKTVLVNRNYSFVDLDTVDLAVQFNDNSLILAEIDSQSLFDKFSSEVESLPPEIPVIVLAKGNIKDSLTLLHYSLLRKPVDKIDLVISIEKMMQDVSFGNQLRMFESGFKQMIENLDEAMFYVDSDRIIRYVSPGITSISGYEPEELMGRDARDFVYETDREQSETDFLKLGEISQYQSEMRIIHKSRKYCWVRSFSQIHKMNDQFLGFSGVLNSIDKEKRALSELKISEDRYRYLVETSHDLIWTLDTDGRFTYINDTASRYILEYSARELVGKLLFDIIYPPFKPQFYAIMRDVVRGRILFNYEGLFFNKSRKRVLLKINARAFFGEDGQIIGISGSASDITDLKKAQKSIIQWNQTLEKRVEERTRELEESKSLYKTLTDTIPDAIIATNTKGECTYISNGALEIFRLDKRESVLGKKILKSVNSGYFDQNSDFFKRVLKEKVIKNIEVKLQRNDGSFFDAAISAALLEKSGSEPLDIIFSTRDISYRKRMEYVSNSTLKLFGVSSKSKSSELMNYGLNECVNITDSRIGFFHIISDDQNGIELSSNFPGEEKNNIFGGFFSHFSPSERKRYMKNLIRKKAIIMNNYILPDIFGKNESSKFNIKRLMIIPIVEEKKLKAVLGVGNKVDEYTRSDEAQASLFVKNLWTIIQRAKAESELLRVNNQLKKANERLGELAWIDSLTELYNRRYLNELLPSFWKRCVRDRVPLAFIMIDIDYFKAYNDYYGHLKGDEVLIKVSQAIRISLKRPGDTAVRYGGEEFIIIMPDTDLAGSINVAEKIAVNLANMSIQHKKTKLEKKYLSISQGVYSALPDFEMKVEDMINNADMALYEAKKSGRNRICSF